MLSIEELGSIGEFIASIGVIASLVYVGYQIREARRAVRASTAQARTDLGAHLISTRYTSEIAEVLVRSVEAPDTLTSVDRLKLSSFLSAHLRHAENLYYQHEQGLLDDYFAAAMGNVATHWIRHYPWAAEEWSNSQHTLPKSFCDFINAELAKDKN